jgi:N-acetyl-anhydromuramyl-L-alanine amidase AmpD
MIEGMKAPLDFVNKILPFGHYKPLKPRPIDTIVIHSSYNAIGKDPYSIEGIIQECKIYGVLPHYLIARDGTIYLLAPEEDIAYHAGESKMPDGRTEVNDFSIGIELIYPKNESPTKFNINL